MKIAILAILVLVIAGCSLKQETPPPQPTNVASITDLLLTNDDLAKLGLTTQVQEIEVLGLNGTNCRTEKYTTTVDSPLGEYGICAYGISNHTQVIIELKKFTNLNDLNGSYQYDSLHYYSVQGLISENTIGDQSRFRVSNEHDYGGEFNDPSVFVYHLWFTKDLYLIHVTSKGTTDVKDDIVEVATMILEKFG